MSSPFARPGWRCPDALLRAIALGACIAAGAASAAALDPRDRLVERSLRIADLIERHDHIVTEERIVELLDAAGQARGPERLDLLYEAANASARMRLEQRIVDAAARLRSEAAAAQSPRHLALAETYDAFALSLSGDLDGALARLELVLSADLSAQDVLVRARARQFLATIAATRGQFNRAASSLRAAFAALPDIGGDDTSAAIRADLLVALGILDSSLRDMPGMVGQFEQALALAGSAGLEVDGEAMVYNLANLFLHLGEYDAAAKLFGRLLAIADTRERASTRFYALYGLMKTARRAGDAAGSAGYAERALATSEPPPGFAVAIAQHQADAMISLGRPADARTAILRAEEALVRWPDFRQPEYVNFNVLLRARLAEAEGDTARALDLMKRYSEEQIRIVREVYDGDLRALRKGLETDLAFAEARHELARRETLAANDMLRVQRLLVALLAAIGIGLLAASLYQRRMARALRESSRQAIEASAAKSRFLANVSHELRTPLNAIIGFSEMSAMEMLGPHGNEAYRNHARIIHRSGRHLLAVINDILDISRVEAGRLDLEDSTVEVASFLEPAFEIVEMRAREKSQTLVMAPCGDLPMVRVDERLMRQAVSNLLLNAIKFSGEHASIDLSAALTPQGELAISVVDTGIGMNEAEIALALETFGQVQSIMTRRHEGAGLGLPLVRTFIERHGGRLEIRSEKGAGTTALIVLPASRVLHPAAPPRHRQEGPPALAATGS